jgi:hypothetical protein
MRAILHFTFEIVARAVALAPLVLLVAGSGVAATGGPSASERERIIFFPSLASASPDNAEWSMTIQGRVFEPSEGSRTRQFAIDGFARFVHADRENANYRKRAGWLLSDSKRDRKVSIRISDRTFALDPSGPAGVFRTDLKVTNEEIAKLAQDGVIPFESVGTAEIVTGVIYVVQPRGTIVVTDMDDTIKDTNMLNREEKMQNTFQRDFKAVDRMSALYGKWRAELGKRIQFHVVSAGPWQLYEPLHEFTQKADFEPLSWDMRIVPIRNSNVVRRELFPNLVRTKKFKIEKITALIKRFPDENFVLVGDSGERDPEAYSEILTRFPDRVSAVLIRNVHGTKSRNPPVASLFRGAAAKKLHVFVDPEAVSPLIAPTDLLPEKKK